MSDLLFYYKIICLEKENERFDQNEKLIDLTKVPVMFRDKINNAINTNVPKGNANKFFTFCNKNRLRMLIENSQNM